MLRHTVSHLTLVAAAACLYLSPTIGVAQDSFVGDQQPVRRVIRLQPQAGSNTAKIEPTTVSRTTQKRFDPTGQASTQNGFDPIQVPDVLLSRQQVSQTVEELPLPETGPASSQTSAVKVASTQSQTVTPQKLTTSTSLVSNLDSSIRTRIESPKHVNVNKPATVNVRLTNNGKTDVGGVEFLVDLPGHTKLVSATPEPASVDGQRVRFQFGAMAVNQGRNIRLEVLPSQRETIDITTSIRTESQQKVLVAVRQPQLEVVIIGPQKMNIGDKTAHELIVTNTGDGVATNVDISTLFPESLKQLESQPRTIAEIAPGRSAKLLYRSQAMIPGPTQLKSSVGSDDGTAPQLATLDVTVFEPTLQVSAIGPKVNFVNRNGIYTINLENKGQVDVTDVQVALTVPKGMKVTTISREADVDAARGILSWRFDKISQGTAEKIQLMAVAAEEGDQISTIIVDSHETAEKQIELATRITTRANVNVAIKNESGPVQVGGKALFTVELANNGSREAMDVNVTVELPESLQAVQSDSPKLAQSGNRITFVEPQISPGGKIAFKFEAVGVLSGEHVVRTITQAEGSERRVVAEDSVFVYDIDEARVSESLKPVVPRR